MRRRRGSPPRENLKDIKEGEAATLYSTIQNLLYKLYIPLIHAYPFGALDQASTGSYMYDAMMASGPAFREAQEAMRNIPTHLQPVMVGSLRQSPEHFRTVYTQVWLESNALCRASPPIELRLKDYLSTEQIVEVHKRVSPPMAMGLYRSGAYPTIASEYNEDGSETFYRVEGSLLSPITPSHPEDVIPRKGIFSFVAPFFIPDPRSLYFVNMQRGGHPSMEKLPAEVGGRAADPKHVFWLLPTNPYYGQMELWAETAYAMHMLIQNHLRTYQFLHENCSTIGQLRRVWPEVITFAPPAVQSKLRAAKTSPTPQNLRMQSIGAQEETAPAHAKRIARVRRQIVELTEACTRAVVLPSLTNREQEFINSFNTQSYYDRVPETGTAIWNS